MSSEDDKILEKMRRTLKFPKRLEYEIGKGVPPSEHQFKPGASGNPSGRPKGTPNKPKSDEVQVKSLRMLILQEANRLVPISDTNGVKHVLVSEAVIRSIAVKAAKGDHAAQKFFMEIVGQAQDHNEQATRELISEVMEYKRYWEAELKRRKDEGIKNLPPPLPHPDDIIVGWDGSVVINGPVTKDDVEFLKFIRGRIKAFKQDAEDFRAMAKRKRADREFLNREIQSAEDQVQYFKNILKEGFHRKFC